MTLAAPAWAQEVTPDGEVSAPKTVVVEPAEPTAPAPPAQAAQPAPATAPAAPAPSPAPAAPVHHDEDDYEQETLFGGHKVDHGGYGGPEIKFGRIAARDAVWFGGKGGWIIDHRLVIGGGAFGLTNNPPVPDALQNVTGVRRTITAGYGGGMLEYFILPDKIVHGTVGVLVGGGGLNIAERDEACMRRNGGDDAENCMQTDVLTDSFFVMEPEAGLEVNVVKFMRVNAGVSYRYVSGIGGIGFENDDLRGLNGTLTVRFGAF